MNTYYLTPEQIETYARLEKLASIITDAISEFDVAVLNADISDTIKIRILDVTYSLNMQGLAYPLHPQSEWMGGEAFKTRSPHIVNER
jgi:hypothetical protein